MARAPALAEIELSILDLRGQRVWLSSDLARRYGVGRGRLPIGFTADIEKAKST